MCCCLVAQLIANSSDKGLCGGINSGIAKAARVRALALAAENVPVSIMLVGDKARGPLARSHAHAFVKGIDEVNKTPINFATVSAVCEEFASVRPGPLRLCTLPSHVGVVGVR